VDGERGGGREGEKEHLLTLTSSTLDLVMIRLVTNRAMLCCAVLCDAMPDAIKGTKRQRVAAQEHTKWKQKGCLRQQSCCNSLYPGGPKNVSNRSLPNRAYLIIPRS
jgi:hypothetical protein